jgi:hypothetical protein
MKSKRRIFCVISLSALCLSPCINAQINVGGNIVIGGGVVGATTVTGGRAQGNGALTISSASGTITGIPIGNSKLADFIFKLKSLNVGSDSIDEITARIGEPLHVSKNSLGQVWKFNYLVADDATIAEYEKCDLAIQLIEQSDMEWSEKSFKQMDVSKIQSKLRDKIQTQAHCQLHIGADGKLASVRVEKIMGGDNELLYVKGDAESISSSEEGEPGLLPTLSSAPQSPKAGQTYLNTTDSHFYGWNGKEWKQLD